jgi:Tfp pilus assembly protein PilE
VFALLALPWVRKCLEAILVLGAIAAIAYGLYDRGVHAGQRTEASSQVQAAKSQFDQIESTFAQQLSAANATTDKYHDLVAVLLQQAQQSAGKAQTASDGAAADSAKVAAVPDSEIQRDLETKLGGPLTSPAILRPDDSMVTEYPDLKQDASALTAQVNDLQSAGAAKDQELDGTTKERDAALEAYDGLLPLYAQAYNAATVRHRHFWCLWICKSKPLSVPKPTQPPGPGQPGQTQHQ